MPSSAQPLRRARPSAGRPTLERIRRIANPLTYKGVSLRVRTGNNRTLLNDPQARLTAMKSVLNEQKLGRAKRVQLAERMVLTVFQIGKFSRNGIVSSEVLRGQTVGRSNPILYQAAITNLIRKGKIVRHSSGEFART